MTPYENPNRGHLTHLSYPNLSFCYPDNVGLGQPDGVGTWTMWRGTKSRRIYRK